MLTGKSKKYIKREKINTLMTAKILPSMTARSRLFILLLFVMIKFLSLFLIISYIKYLLLSHSIHYNFYYYVLKSIYIFLRNVDSGI